MTQHNWSPLWENTSPGLTHILFLNVNPATIGDATLVVSPTGQAMLVDAGVAGAGREIIAPMLAQCGIRRLRRLVISHLHDDHFGGVEELIDWPGLTVDEVIWSPFSIERYRQKESMYADPWARLIWALPDLCHRRRIRLTEPRLHARWALGGGATAHVIDIAHPEIDVPNFVNNNNIVLQITHGSITAMLTGDQGFEEEQRVLDSRHPVCSTVLKAAHHAGAGSNGAAWMQAVRPEVTVYPMPKWLSEDPRGIAGHARIQPYTQHIYRTWEHGHVDIVTDGRTYRVFTEKAIPAG